MKPSLTPLIHRTFRFVSLICAALFFSLTGPLMAANASSNTNCAVATPSKTVIYEGYPIHLDLERMLDSKSYHESTSDQPAAYVLLVETEIENGRPFRTFHATFSFIDANDDSIVFTAHGQKKCIFTDLCSVSDAVKALQRGFEKMEKSLPVCPAS
jgi:hypothetical protein